MNTKFKFLCAIFLLIPLLWIIHSNGSKPNFVLPPNYKQVLHEVAYLDVWIGSLTPDPLGKTLAFSSGTKDGRRLAIIDLNTLQKTVIPTTNEVSYVFGWSPDGRYLAFDQVPYQPEKLHKTTPVFFESWLTLYDRQTGATRRLTASTNVMETPFFWLADNRYLICQRNLTNDYGVFSLGDLANDQIKPVSEFQPDAAVVSSQTLAYALKSEIYLMDLKALPKAETRWDLTNAAIKKISDFKTNGFNGVVWLHYNPAKSNFLFCARPKDSEWRYLYQFDPTTQLLTQLSHEDTYNGQWLLDGTGFAYVINTNDAFQLAIRVSDPTLNTNLFENGNVVIYKASVSGDKVYASAAIGTEPHGIWEYSITNRHLKKVTEGTDNLIATRIVNPVEFQLKSFDGLQIPCFLFPPRENSARHSGRKYPLVLYVPPISSQFQRTFEAQSQLFANMGFYYATVNYRGCDGYGARYSKLYDPINAAKDILALYTYINANYSDVDYNNVFLITSSAGVNVLTELLTSTPELWRAVGMDKCFLSDQKQLKADKLPPMITVMGTQDPAFKQMQDFVAWAKANNFEIQSVTHPNAGHVTYSASDREDTLAKIINFFVKHIR